MHVLYREVGLQESGFDRVGGGRVGGGARNNALHVFDSYSAGGSAHIGARIGGNPLREVATTELWLPAA